MLLALPQLLRSPSPCTTRSHHCVLTKSQAYWVVDACHFPPYRPSLTPCTKLLQSCLTLWEPMDHSSPGSLVHGILQARILEWVAMPSSRGFSQPRDWIHVSYGFTGKQVLYNQHHLGSSLWPPEPPHLFSHPSLQTHEFGQALGDGEGQESLACYSPWGRKEMDMTERLNNNSTNSGSPLPVSSTSTSSWTRVWDLNSHVSWLWAGRHLLSLHSRTNWPGQPTVWPLVLGRMFDYSIRSMVSESCSMTVPGPKPHTSSLTGFARGQASLPGPCASFTPALQPPVPEGLVTRHCLRQKTYRPTKFSESTSSECFFYDPHILEAH